MAEQKRDYYEVLGVYLRENDNQVIKTAEVIDVDPADNNFKTLLKGTGLAVGSDTEYYVNYGFTGKGSEGRTAAGGSQAGGQCYRYRRPQGRGRHQPAGQPVRR